MKVNSQLERAQIESLSSLPSAATTGRVAWNTTDTRFYLDDATNWRAILRNDQKAIFGNNGTAANNIRFHRGASGVLQFVSGADSTAEGTLSTALNQISGRAENYTNAGKPTFGNAGRIIYVTDTGFLNFDTGSAWVVVSSASITAPVITEYTGGASGTFVVAAGKYAKVKMTGSGGSGGGSGTSGYSNGTTGNDTTFGAATANGGMYGGVGASFIGGAGGTGGSGSLGGYSGSVIVGQSGGYGMYIAIASQYGEGGLGGSSPYFSGGALNTPNGAAGANATGPGGGGAGGSHGVTLGYGGGGGGSGGFCEFVVGPGSYAYSVGNTTTSVGGAGTSGSAGGQGFAGRIIVELYG